MKRQFANLIAAAALAMASTVAFAQAAATGAIAPVVKKAPVDTPQRVLFIGNSLMYYSGGLQTHTHRIATSIDPKLASIRSGFRSVNITSVSVEAFPVDFLTTPGNIGVKEPFQLAVLQPSANDAMTDAGRAKYRRVVGQWDTAMKKIGGKLALIWIYPYVDKGWNADMYRKNGEMVVSAANELGAYVIPIGPAFEEAYRQRPGLRLQMQYDGYHTTAAGQYLSAAVMFASLYGRSPEGSDYDYFGALDKETVAFLQKIAVDTVKKFYAQQS